MDGAGQRAQAVTALLRQLSLGLSTYRLFPGDLDQPAFGAAVQRIRAAADLAISAGPVVVDVHGEGFLLVDESAEPAPIADDEARARLAMVLFERRVEQLEIRGVPDPHDLSVLYGSLCATPDEVLEAGGVPAMLRHRGVSSIVTRDVEPEGGRGVAVAHEVELTPEQRELWARLDDAAGFAAGLMIEGLGGGGPADQARAVYRRLQALLATLPERFVRSPDPYARFREVISYLPQGVGNAFTSLAITRARDDLLGRGYIGTMSDGELARLIVDTEGAMPPLDVAQRLVETAGRRTSLVDLTAALLVGGETEGTVLTGLGEQISAAIQEQQVRGLSAAVSDIIGNAVLTTADADASDIRDAYPRTDADVQQDAFHAFHDYLRNERDRDRLVQVLETWTGVVRARIVDGDVDEVRRLLFAVDELRDRGGDWVELVEIHHRSAIDRAAAVALVGRGVAEGFDHVLPLLQPFGQTAIERLMEVLADAPEQGVRAQLVSVIADLVRRGPHVDVLAPWLRDPRWYIVRNTVTILQRAGGAQAVPLLVQASQHPEPNVRREAVKALPLAAGAEAVPYLRRLGNDPEPTVRAAAVAALGALTAPAAAVALADLARSGIDLDERRRALDELATHPAEDAGELLRQVVRDLPRKLRRHARALVKERSVP